LLARSAASLAGGKRCFLVLPGWSASCDKSPGPALCGRPPHAVCRSGAAFFPFRHLAAKLGQGSRGSQARTAKRGAACYFSVVRCLYMSVRRWSEVILEVRRARPWWGAGTLSHGAVRVFLSFAPIKSCARNIGNVVASDARSRERERESFSARKRVLLQV